MTISDSIERSTKIHSNVKPPCPESFPWRLACQQFLSVVLFSWNLRQSIAYIAPSCAPWKSPVWCGRVLSRRYQPRATNNRNLCDCERSLFCHVGWGTDTPACHHTWPWVLSAVSHWFLRGQCLQELRPDTPKSHPIGRGCLQWDRIDLSVYIDADVHIGWQWRLIFVLLLPLPASFHFYF